MAADCKGQDKSTLFYKCTDPGHKPNTCESPKCCVLCKDRGIQKEDVAHILGSGRPGRQRRVTENKRRKKSSIMIYILPLPSGKYLPSETRGKLPLENLSNFSKEG